MDLIHDDWFGLAPLASPESLSELSSISSRTSFTNLDKIQTLSASYELKTPKVMRRTPKIMGNLSTCADDVRNVRYFQKLAHGRMTSSVTNSSSSNLSFESANSRNNSPRCLREPRKEQQKKETSCESDDFQSAEDILDGVIASAGCAEFFNSPGTYLETHFDDIFQEEVKPPSSQPLSPQEFDQDVVSNFAIDLNLDQEHRSLQFLQTSLENTSSSKPNSLDSGSTCRTTPSDVKNVTFNPQVINIDSRESPDPSPNRSKKSDRWHLLPRKNRRKSEVKSNKPSSEQVPKTILCSKRRNSEEEFFSRTEDLPLLSGLSCEKTSPGYVRRKTYVYPTVSVISKGESSV